MKLYQSVLISAIPLVALQCVARGQDSVQTRFARAISLVESNDRLAAKKEFDQIPEAELARVGVLFLRENPTLSDELREYCFRVLATRGAARSDEGHQLFVEGLLDPTVQRWAVAGLASVSPERRKETVEQFLQAHSVAKKRDSKSIISQSLGIFGRWGDAAHAALPFVEQVFHDSEYSEFDRALAARTMLHIGPAARALSHFEKENLELSVGAIGFVGGHTNGAFNADQATRMRLRQFVQSRIPAIGDPRERREAVKVLLFAYGRDFVAGNEKDGFHVHPHFVEAVSSIASNDPDAGVRELAQSLLDTMDRRLENALRKKRKREAASSKSSAPDNP